MQQRSRDIRGGPNRHRRFGGLSEHSSELISEWEEDRWLRATRRIHLVGEICDEMAAFITQRLQRLASDGNEPVHLYISSDGGYVEAGHAIIDAMLVMPGPVVTIITGRAFSMGAVIAAYGTPGYRFITPLSGVMLHPTSYGVDHDYVEQQLALAQYTKGQYDTMIRLLAKRIKKRVKRLHDVMDKGLWMNAEQAIDLGLTDAIWTAKHERKVNELAARDGGSGEKMAQIGMFLHMLGEAVERGENISMERVAG